MTVRKPLADRRARRDEAVIRRILGDKDYKVLGGFLSGTYRLLQKLEAADQEIRLSRRRGLKMSDGLSDEARAALEGLAACLEGLGANEARPRTAATNSAPQLTLIPSRPLKKL